MKHPGPNISKHEYRVATAEFQACKELIQRLHYARGCANTAVYRHGLFEASSGRQVGAALWMPPTATVARRYNPENPRAVVVLSRLAIEDEVARNAESFLVGRSIRLIRAEGRHSVLLTYADEFMGHRGGIYLALGFEPLLSSGHKGHTWVDKDGVRRGAKRGKRNLSPEEMRAEGFTFVGAHEKRGFIKRIA